MTSEQEILWLAGLLEGEGYFVLERDTKGGHNVSTPRIVLSMTDGDVVEHAAKIMQAKRVRQYRPNNLKPNNRDVFATRVTGPKAIAIMRAILPFMGQRRKAKIEQILLGYESRSTWSIGARRRCERNKRSPQEPQLFAIEKAG